MGAGVCVAAVSAGCEYMGGTRGSAFVEMAGPGICVLCSANTCAS